MIVLSRERVLEALTTGPARPEELAHVLRSSRSTVFRRLSELAAEGVVRALPHGYYTVASVETGVRPADTGESHGEARPPCRHPEVPKRQPDPRETASAASLPLARGISGEPYNACRGSSSSTATQESSGAAALSTVETTENKQALVEEERARARRADEMIALLRAQSETSQAILRELASLRAELREVLAGRVSPGKSEPAPQSDAVVTPEVEREVQEALEIEMDEAFELAAKRGTEPPGPGLRVTKARELRASSERRAEAFRRRALRENPPAPEPTGIVLRPNEWKAEIAAWKAAPVDPEAPERLRAAAERLAQLAAGSGGPLATSPSPAPATLQEEGEAA